MTRASYYVGEQCDHSLTGQVLYFHVLLVTAFSYSVIVTILSFDQTMQCDHSLTGRVL